MPDILAFAIILSGVIRLFLYEKKIVYLSRYQGEKKGSGAGFARISGKGNEWCVDIQVKKDFCRQGNEQALYFLIRSEKIFVEKISVQAEGMSFHGIFRANEGEIFIHGREYWLKDLWGIEIRNNSETFVAGYLSERENKKTEHAEKDKIYDINREMKQFQETEKADKLEQRAATVFAADLEQEPQEICTFDNKWEQLINDYPQIRPFGDERVFISIEPKDFIILRASYQKLVNNSFLLHGFYNYRYLILGPDKEMGESDGECFYLGVPGTYFEREKMVAVMFGFEGFECAGPVEIGKFGFYMRRVEL